MKTSILLVTAVCCTALLVLLPAPTRACVGKTLAIGIVDSPRERVLASLFTVFIAERTGTTVVVKAFPDPLALHQGILGGAVDLSLTLPALAWRDIMGKDGEVNEETLKGYFLETFNLVWGVPVGASHFTPLMRRDTLVKFPALPKLLRKLEGKIAERWLETAATGATGEAERERQARGLLKELKLI